MSSEYRPSLEAVVDVVAPADQLAEHLEVTRRTAGLLPQLAVVSELIVDRYQAGGTVFSFGNGGSAADAQHLAAELVGRYLRDRRPLPAHALTADPSVLTCVGNDYSFDDVFARQIEALAGPADVVVAFSTSGQSANVVEGLAAARRRKAMTVLFGGRDGGRAMLHADYPLVVPSGSTARIQEMHVLLLHLLCEQIDGWAAAHG